VRYIENGIKLLCKVFPLQKLTVSQELSAQQIAQLESGVKLWKEKNENTQASLDRKDEEIASMTRKMAEYESQVSINI